MNMYAITYENDIEEQFTDIINADNMYDAIEQVQQRIICNDILRVDLVEEIEKDGRLFYHRKTV